MIDGNALAMTAKHNPQNLDPDVVRQAGRQLEMFSDLLSGLESFTLVEGEHVLSFNVSKDTFDSIMFHMYSA